jgi:L-ribulose-5-phosphate 4-epimerase
MESYKGLREAAYEVNLLLPKYNLVILTWGNVSAFDPEKKVFAIKPSGVPYDRLTPDDMVVVDLEGRVVWGSQNPSSDTPTHLVLYREFPGIGGITHTHSPSAVAWAQAAEGVPVYGTTHADHCAGSVLCSSYLSEEAVERAYEAETGNLIVHTFDSANRSPLESPMILVAGHGPFTWGKTAEESVQNAVILEEICSIALKTRVVKPKPPLLPAYIFKKHWERKHGPDAYYGQGKH